MRNRTRRGTLLGPVLAATLALVVTAAVGATMIAMMEEHGVDVFFEKVVRNEESALKKSQIVLLADPEDVVAGIRLKEIIAVEMHQNLHGTLPCYLRAGSYKQIGERNGLLKIDHVASDGRGCTGYYEVSPRFWTIVYTLEKEKG